MFENFLKRKITKQFIRFCLVGTEITIFSYIVFISLFYFLRVNYIISAGIGFIAGILLGFVFNKLWTFESRERAITSLPKYFLVYTFTLFFTMVSIYFLVEKGKLNPLLSNFILQPFIILINFFGTKVFAFKNFEW